MGKKKAPAQAELPRLHYIRRLSGRRLPILHWPEDRAVDRVEVDGHILEVWHLSRLDWYEVRIDGDQAHVSGHLFDVARAWRDNCLEWR
jgi:hypothetical protein